MTVVAVLQARVSSSRLPGKVLLPILERPMLARQIERLVRSRSIDHLVVATSTGADDDAIEALCNDIGVGCFRGSLDDVLDRVQRCAARYRADHVVRLTGDCPLADPVVIDRVVSVHLQGGVDYTSNVSPPTWPDGLDVEVVRAAALEAAAREARLPLEREHVTPFIVNRPERFTRSNVVANADRSHIRLTVDEPRDLELVRQIFKALYPEDPNFGIEEVLALLDDRPELMRINAGIGRNEGLTRSAIEDAGLRHADSAKDD